MTGEAQTSPRYSRAPVLNLSGINRLRLIRQNAQGECGLACVAMMASYFGFKTDIHELRRSFAITGRGTDLASLVEVAREIGLTFRPVSCSLKELKRIRLPAIIHWNFDHFVVLSSLKKKATVYDPTYGIRSLSTEELNKSFTGVVIEVSPSQDFVAKKQPKKLTLSKLIRFDKSFLNPFGLGLLFSIFVELFILSAPFYMQVTIDEVLLKGDRPLLTTLAVGFGTILVFQMVSDAFRSLTFQLLGHVASYDMSARIFRQMMRLKASFFASRELGDVQHRILGVEQIRMFLTSGAPMVILDGMFGILLLIILAFYSLPLTAGILFVTTLFVLTQLVMFRLMKRAAGDLIVAEADAQTVLLETLRAMPTLKASAMEQGREIAWQHANARKANAGIRVGNLDVATQTVSQFLFQGTRIILVFIGASMVFSGNFTIGMISALIAYYGMFQRRVVALIDQFINFLLLDVPLSRLTDIVFEKPEAKAIQGGRTAALNGEIALKNASFSYGLNSPYILRSANLLVQRGEFVAIVGPSGAGKSTILKLLTGLETLHAGDVLFDGKPIQHWDRKVLRSQISTVLQDDTLLRGTIAENVSFFDEAYDHDRVLESCSKASIRQEIESMPMGYETRVGDMGSTLSGGQIQRLLIARALYRQPKILILDEPTSNLDIAAEQAVFEQLNALDATRIVVTHRPETILRADRVVALKGGRLTPMPKFDPAQIEKSLKTTPGSDHVPVIDANKLPSNNRGNSSVR